LEEVNNKMNSHNQEDCCGNLFNKFTFKNLRKANLLLKKLPNKKGVYVIRVKERGVSVEEIIEKVKQFVQNLDWKLVGKFILNRISRLENINKCSIIYIGSAGTRKSSKNTLKGRYKEFFHASYSNVSYLGSALF